jgi:hypothetical protein
MHLLSAAAVATMALLSLARPAAGQSQDPSRKWEILDNSFLIEESFNQERGVMQNIFSWTRDPGGGWGASFTQEWPAPGTAHQLSYTLPFAAISDATGWGDVLLNYRYQLLEESRGVPAIAPRVSVILPTGRSEDGLGGGTYGIQFNLAASKQYGDFYVHGNAGFTWRPDIQRTPSLGASGIWRATPMLNLMLEAMVALDESAIVSPGVRRGWNFGDRQLVVGAAVPFTRAAGDTSTALLAYVSYELPFSR